MLIGLMSVVPVTSPDSTNSPWWGACNTSIVPMSDQPITKDFITYLINSGIGDLAGVGGAFLQVEHLHLIVPPGHLSVHRIDVVTQGGGATADCCC